MFHYKVARNVLEGRCCIIKFLEMYSLPKNFHECKFFFNQSFTWQQLLAQYGAQCWGEQVGAQPCCICRGSGCIDNPWGLPVKSWYAFSLCSLLWGDTPVSFLLRIVSMSYTSLYVTVENTFISKGKEMVHTREID